jgi:hypothetical protein
VASIIACSPEVLDITYTWMPSPIYQNVSLSIRRCPSKFFNVTMWEYCTVDNQILDVAKFTTLTPSSLPVFCKLSFPIVGLKMSSLPTLALKSPYKISISYFRNLLHTCSSSF